VRAKCHDDRLGEDARGLRRTGRLFPVAVSRSRDVKLRRMNENTVASGIMPIQFGPSPASGLHYPSVIVEVTPDEFQKIENDEPRLPHGWTVGDQIPKS